MPTIILSIIAYQIQEKGAEEGTSTKEGNRSLARIP